MELKSKQKFCITNGVSELVQLVSDLVEYTKNNNTNGNLKILLLSKQISFKLVWEYFCGNNNFLLVYRIITREDR